MPLVGSKLRNIRDLHSDDRTPEKYQCAPQLQRPATAHQARYGAILLRGRWKVWVPIAEEKKRGCGKLEERRKETMSRFCYTRVTIRKLNPPLPSAGNKSVSSLGRDRLVGARLSKSERFCEALEGSVNQICAQQEGNATESFLPCLYDSRTGECLSGISCMFHIRRQ